MKWVTNKMKPGIYERTDGSLNNYVYIEVFDNNTWQPFCDPRETTKSEGNVYVLSGEEIEGSFGPYKLTEIKTREEAYFIKFL